jgi:hypothetical protein
MAMVVWNVSMALFIVSPAGLVLGNGQWHVGGFID